MILNAGLPDVVRHGDRFGGVFTVRNASDETQRIDVAGRIEGYLERPHRTVTPGSGRIPGDRLARHRTRRPGAA